MKAKGRNGKEKGGKGTKGREGKGSEREVEFPTSSVLH